MLPVADIRNLIQRSINFQVIVTLRAGDMYHAGTSSSQHHRIANINRQGIAGFGCTHITSSIREHSTVSLCSLDLDVPQLSHPSTAFVQLRRNETLRSTNKLGQVQGPRRHRLQASKYSDLVALESFQARRSSKSCCWTILLSRLEGQITSPP